MKYLLTLIWFSGTFCKHFLIETEDNVRRKYTDPTPSTDVVQRFGYRSNISENGETTTQSTPLMPSSKQRKASGVTCGGHRAKTCELCPMGNGQTWCNGECEWSKTKCVPRSGNTTVPETSGVSCGGHRAKTCELCPQGIGESWCNGECEWSNGKCYPEGKGSVSCGGHNAKFCELCPQGNGKSWCNGECEWRNGKCYPEGCLEKPFVKGPCRMYIPSWSFNSGLCAKFVYGGCGGNGNRFKTSADCQETCSKNPGCLEKPFVKGYCKMYIPSWSFDNGVCKEFVYGGCGGNGNRFMTSAECHGKCGKNPGCWEEPFVVGPCRARILVWSFDNGVCKMFFYGGCNGNGNRFPTLAECQGICGKKRP